MGSLNREHRNIYCVSVSMLNGRSCPTPPTCSNVVPRAPTLLLRVLFHQAACYILDQVFDEEAGSIPDIAKYGNTSPVDWFYQLACYRRTWACPRYCQVWEYLTHGLCFPTRMLCTVILYTYTYIYVYVCKGNPASSLVVVLYMLNISVQRVPISMQSSSLNSLCLFDWNRVRVGQLNSSLILILHQ